MLCKQLPDILPDPVCICSLEIHEGIFFFKVGKDKCVSLFLGYLCFVVFFNLQKLGLSFMLFVAFRKLCYYGNEHFSIDTGI